MTHPKRAEGTPFYYVGPDLSEGPLPALFYFALSCKESLLVDPYNQPVVHLTNAPVRVFSLDLPFHGDDLLSVDAMKHWTHSEERIKEFLDTTTEAIEFLFASGDLTSGAAFGLSRGGFIASHIAARVPQIQTLLAFAPLTKMESYKDLQLSFLTEKLCTKNIRVYIGGRDTRVDTDFCYGWIRNLIEAAHENRVRSVPIELYIKPSIGYQGHGTAPETFRDGASWLLEKVL